MRLTTFSPFHNYLLVDEVERETQRNGIYLPDTDKNALVEGVVVAVGPGKYDSGILVPMTAKLGDRVTFNSGESRTIRLNGSAFTILSEDSIYGAIKG